MQYHVIFEPAGQIAMTNAYHFLIKHFKTTELDLVRMLRSKTITLMSFITPLFLLLYLYSLTNSNISAALLIAFHYLRV